MASIDKNANVFGFHPVLEACKNPERRCFKIVMMEDKNTDRLRPLLDEAKSRGVLVEFQGRKNFLKAFGHMNHQGVVGYFSKKRTLSLEEIVENAFLRKEKPVIAILDSIQDPQNLGAIIRSAEVLGIDGLIIPNRRSAPLNETVAKCSSGAVERMPIGIVKSLNQAVSFLKEEGFWVAAVIPEGEMASHDYKHDSSLALILGGEGKGVRSGLKKSCDFTLNIPMQSDLGSLNVSAAAAIIFYEITKKDTLNIREKLSGL